MQEIINGLWESLTSQEGSAITFIGAILTYAITLVIEKILKNKNVAKYNSSQKELKAVKEEFDSYSKKSKETIDEMKAINSEMKKEYSKAVQITEQILENMIAQNDALNTAFKNSNLVASAKDLVEEKLKIKSKNNEIPVLTENENKKDDQSPVSNAVSEEEKVIGVDNNAKNKIIRVK